jgi:hypothetical protein
VDLVIHYFILFISTHQMEHLNTPNPVRLYQRRNGFVSAMLDEEAKTQIASLSSFKPCADTRLSIGEAIVVRQVASPSPNSNSWLNRGLMLEKIPEESELILTSADELETITEDGNSVVYFSDDSSSVMSIE